MFKFLTVRAFSRLAAGPAVVAATAYVASNVAEADASQHQLPPGASDAPTTVKYSFVSYNANNPCETLFLLWPKKTVQC